MVVNGDFGTEMTLTDESSYSLMMSHVIPLHKFVVDTFQQIDFFIFSNEGY